MIFSITKTLTLLAAMAPLHSASADHPKPKQGVFLLSNQPENEVGVYESLDDGTLSWVGSYKTGGIGYPEADGADQLDSLGSSNSISYHVWDDKQWIVAANAGGPDGEASISLMEIDPATLQLTQVSKAILQGQFTCSVTAHEDRVCAVTCAGSVTMECFRIQKSSRGMIAEFIHDFEANIPPVEDRPYATSAAYGPGNILFSGDGLQVGVIMKGDALLNFGNATDNRLHSAPKAGFHSFPVSAEGYAAPSFIALPDETLPFAFTWRSGELDTTKQIVLVVNIAGESMDFPECDDAARCRSSITSILADFDTDSSVVLSKVDEVNADQIDLCWVDYRFGHFYTGNFLSDSVTIGTVSREGQLSVERSSPIGRGTIPNDIAHMGRKIDGGFYLYTENQGSAEVGVHRVIENTPSFQLEVMIGAPYPAGVTGDAWIGSHGLAATLLSEEELFAMYKYTGNDSHSSSGTHQAATDMEDITDTSSARAASATTFLLGAFTYLVTLVI
ncbi:MAG: hypothetical protein SGBAC_007142 [Bacillariaceae sp.]